MLLWQLVLTSTPTKPMHGRNRALFDTCKRLEQLLTQLGNPIRILAARTAHFCAIEREVPEARAILVRVGRAEVII